MADSGFQRGSVSTLSLREKHTLKRRINQEHNSNFRAGYVNIQEDFLHRTGIRGRKTYCVYGITFILFIAAVVNLVITVMLLTTLKINREGMESLEFMSSEDLLRFLKDSDMGDSVTIINSQVTSLAETELNITGEAAPVTLLVKSNNTGQASVSVNEDKVKFEAQEGFKVLSPDTGETIFSSNFSEFKFPEKMESLDVNQAFTNRVVSGLAENLKLESASDVTVRAAEDVNVDTNEVLVVAQKDLVLTNWNELLIEGQNGLYLPKVRDIAYTGGSDPFDNSQESFRICICVPSGKTFAVPAPHTCAEANEDKNPCL